MWKWSQVLGVFVAYLCTCGNGQWSHASLQYNILPHGAGLIQCCSTGKGCQVSWLHVVQKEESCLSWSSMQRQHWTLEQSSPKDWILHSLPRLRLDRISNRLDTQENHQANDVDTVYLGIDSWMKISITTRHPVYTSIDFSSSHQNQVLMPK